MSLLQKVMSTKYKFVDKQGVYFTTSTVVDWVECIYKGCLQRNFVGQYSFLSVKPGLITSCLGIDDKSPLHDLFV